MRTLTPNTLPRSKHKRAAPNLSTPISATLLHSWKRKAFFCLAKRVLRAHPVRLAKNFRVNLLAWAAAIPARAFNARSAAVAAIVVRAVTDAAIIAAARRVTVEIVAIVVATIVPSTLVARIHVEQTRVLIRAQDAPTIAAAGPIVVDALANASNVVPAAASIAATGTLVLRAVHNSFLRC